jgi:hypothetical protein
MTLIDAHLPVYQFRELHQLLINAAPGDLWWLIRPVSGLMRRRLLRRIATAAMHAAQRRASRDWPGSSRWTVKLPAI